MSTPVGEPAGVDRRVFLLAAAAILWVIVVGRRLVSPSDAVAWSYQSLTLCLIVAAIAGRALLGRRDIDTAPDLSWRPALVRLIIGAAAILPFLPSLTVGFVSDDFGLAASAHDARNVLDAVRSPAFVSFYRPFVLLIWWLGDRLWHGAPLGFHLFAVLIHAANALLVYALGRRLIGSVYGALVAALLFAVHPLHVEPVSWPAASSDLVCTAFGLLSLLAALAYVGSTTPWPLLLPGALAAFVLALLSKEVAFALPGVVVLILALQHADSRRRAVAVAVSYLLVLVLYLFWRSQVLGGLGGYTPPRSFWNSVFPSSPLLMIADFLFPMHATLLSALRWWFWWPIVLVMGAGAFWWLTGLDRIPSRRLWLWLGFVIALSVPSWTFRWQPSASLEWSRFAYLPTIGLAWLFGDLCAGRGPSWRRSGAVAACTIAACIALTLWYTTPWLKAGAQARQVVAAGVALVHDLRPAGHPPTLYVRDLPEAYKGAPVFAYCYPQALGVALGRHISVRVVSGAARGAIPSDVMSAWHLLPNEYLVAYDSGSARMRIIRRGPPPDHPAAGGSRR